MAAVSTRIPIADIPSLQKQRKALNSTPEPTKGRCDTVSLGAKAREMDLDNIAQQKLPWVEKLDITAKVEISVDADDDLARELAFYNQALEAAKEAKKRLTSAGVPFDRPDDFYAEMLKSDTHMEKIRDKIVEEANSVKKSHEAKKMRENKKFGKQIQSMKLQERQKAKSAVLDKINEFKAKRKNNPGEGLAEDFDIALDSTDASKGKNAKRLRKDKTYGMGGKKKHQKSNTRESLDDFKFDNVSNKKLHSGFRGSKRSKSSSQNRPGKQRRQKMRSMAQNK